LAENYKTKPNKNNWQAKKESPPPSYLTNLTYADKLDLGKSYPTNPNH